MTTNAGQPGGSIFKEIFFNNISYHKDVGDDASNQCNVFEVECWKDTKCCVEKEGRNANEEEKIVQE